MATATAKKLKIRPLDDRVVVEPFEAEERTRGGIVLPDTAREKPQQGKVIATGPGKLLEKTGEVIAAGPGARGEDGKLTPMGVKSGDKVLFGKWSGTEVKIDGEELLIMKESDIMGILG